MVTRRVKILYAQVTVLWDWLPSWRTDPRHCVWIRNGTVWQGCAGIRRPSYRSRLLSSWHCTRWDWGPSVAASCSDFRFSVSQRGQRWRCHSRKWTQTKRTIYYDQIRRGRYRKKFQRESEKGTQFLRTTSCMSLTRPSAATVICRSLSHPLSASNTQWRLWECLEAVRRLQKGWFSQVCQSNIEECDV